MQAAIKQAVEPDFMPGVLGDWGGYDGHRGSRKSTVGMRKGTVFPCTQAISPRARVSVCTRTHARHSICVRVCVRARACVRTRGRARAARGAHPERIRLRMHPGIHSKPRRTPRKMTHKHGLCDVFCIVAPATLAQKPAQLIANMPCPLCNKTRQPYIVRVGLPSLLRSKTDFMYMALYRC